MLMHFNIGLYRVSTLKVEHRQLTLCIQFIDMMPLFRYINNIKELNYNINSYILVEVGYKKYFFGLRLETLIFHSSKSSGN
jgi:hypothetical protein